MEIRVSVNDQQALDAFGSAPDIMSASIDRNLSRAAHEVARAAKEVAPKAFSNLTNSILSFRVKPLHWRVAPGVNYSAFVEQGTRPHMPPPGSLLPWVERVLGLRGAKGARSAYLIARAISRRGTKAKPYLSVAAERTESRVIQLVREGVDAGVREVFGQ